MPSPDAYRILVSAGTDYDPATHVPVRVNSATPLHLHGPGGDVWLNVRVKNYRGPERHPEVGEVPDPATSPYFEKEPHKTNDDTYGIGVWFVPRAPAGKDGEDGEDGEDSGDSSVAGISGTDLQWGNDFDEPLRDRLPPGFGAALRIVKWWIDPGLEGDPYADKPYLYGPALSSFNQVYAALGDVPFDEDDTHETDEQNEEVEDDEEEKNKSARSNEKKIEQSEDKNKSERSEDQKENGRSKDTTDHTQPPVDADCGLWFGEGGDAGGRAWRASIGAPGDGTGDGKVRMKWALGADAKATWRWQYGQGYGLDFYNGYLDFADLTLRLPGFHLPLLRYYASDKAEKTCLRYVLRHRGTGQVYLVVVFRLVRSTNKDGGEDDEETDTGDVEEEPADVDEDMIIDEARRKLSAQDISADDVD
ncbi:hypothetical protein HMPREF1624_03897 [Sporothrix schenckii ATCC 58251]|uniref:Domain of unknown function at the cortex 1 domain-containing protein n=1 Tax=Sporothrix schenckii (strain ATCC 58251 / de Perez 2211183) TaxID=1391915 RepID=U7PY06_SPOS1|nr:hypothetical protein HMPREF1624_03897 [Sporothrix schenckii ATCC 58251]